MTPSIQNVSDTARWVAAYRARETERPDALFRDPLAARLAGPVGEAMANRGPRQMRSGWFIVARTKLIDDALARAIAAGADLVVNLAAGLDTRPYRLEVPSALQWVEADLPAMVAEKNVALAAEIPRCRLTRVGVDLADGDARRNFLREIAAGARRTIVITEGLLVYLDGDTVTSLANDIAATPGLREWMLDLCSPAVLTLIARNYGGALDRAPMKFAPPDGVAFFERLGWRALQVDSQFHFALRHRRLPPWMRIAGRLMRQPDPRKPRGPWSAVATFAPPA